MSSNTDHGTIVYMAVPMKDAPATIGDAVPSAPAIFIPTSSHVNDNISRSNSSTKRSLIKAAIVLSMGFAATTLAWAMVFPHHRMHGRSPCLHSLLRGSPRMAEMPSDAVDKHDDHHGHGMGHHHDMMHDHHGMRDHGMMKHPDHEMMMNPNHGMMKHPDHEMMMNPNHGMMMHPYKTSKERRWKTSFLNIHSSRESDSSSSNSISQSSSQDTALDGWYAGHESHDGWHASFHGMMMRSGGDSADSEDSSDSADSMDSADSKDSADSADFKDRADSEDSADSNDSADSEDSADSKDSADSEDRADDEDSEDSADSQESADIAESADTEDSTNSVESLGDSVPESIKNVKDIIDEMPFEAVERVEFEYEDGLVPGLP